MKGQQTKAAIVDAALALATQIGLEGLSIGALAEVTQMSKSGVFAHFGSREELQISVIREYHARFEEEVFSPALHEPRGLPRLRALFDNWMKRTSVEIDSGCIYISGAVEFDDRPGPVRDALVGDRCRPGSAAMERAIRIGERRGPPARRHRRRADAVRDPRPDPRAALRGALPAKPGSPMSARAPASTTSARHRGARRRAPAARAAADARRRAVRPSSPSISSSPSGVPHAHYTPPLRDMQFVMHEVLKVTDEFKPLPPHAEVDADTINAVLEEGGKFAAEVLSR